MKYTNGILSLLGVFFYVSMAVMMRHGEGSVLVYGLMPIALLTTVFFTYACTVGVCIMVYQLVRSGYVWCKNNQFATDELVNASLWWVGFGIWALCVEGGYYVTV